MVDYLDMMMVEYSVEMKVSSLVDCLVILMVDLMGNDWVEHSDDDLVDEMVDL